MIKSRELEFVEKVEKLCKDIKLLEKENKDTVVAYDELEIAINELIAIRKLR